MNVFDLFMVGIEVSIAIAGFAGIVATFQFRDGRAISRGDAVALTMIVKFSLCLAFCCVLPLGLAAFGIEGPTLWALCSTFGVALQLYLSVWVYDAMRGASRSTAAKLMIGVFHTIAALNIVVQLLNTAGVFFHREPGPVIVGIVYGLALAAYMFSRLLLRPVWRAVIDKEVSVSRDIPKGTDKLSH